MSENPFVETERLILKLISEEDVSEIERFAGNTDIASTTSERAVPKPGEVRQWVKERCDSIHRKESAEFVIIQKEQDIVIGVTGIGVEYKTDESMQLGYWLGKEYWNHGYCTEAARAVLEYGFEILGLNRIFSRHFASNPSSGRVLWKIGMKYEGTLREAFKKGDKFENLECYGILRREYVHSNT